MGSAVHCIVASKDVTGIYTGIIQPNEGVKMVISQYFWAIILWAIVLKTYQNGLKKFEAQGG